MNIGVKEQKIKQVLYHRGEDGCNGIFAYFTRKMAMGDPITEEIVIWPDGRQAKAYEPFACGSCGVLQGNWEDLEFEDINLH